MVEGVEAGLGYLGTYIADASLWDLMRQAQAAASKPKESQAPKNGAEHNSK
jgi:hypothetical protein